MDEFETVQETTTATAPHPTSQAAAGASSGQNAPSHVQESLAARWLEKGDVFIYGTVGACFFLAALFTLVYAFYNFFQQLVTNPALVNGQSMSNTSPQNIAQA